MTRTHTVPPEVSLRNKEARLIELALARYPVSADMVREQLVGLDPDAPGFEFWQALTLLEPLLEPDSPWAVRVTSLRRRSHYAATIAASKASQISSALTTAGIRHAVFGDLALATAYGQPPGTRAMTYLSVWVDPAAQREQLVRAVGDVPGLRPPRNHGRSLRTSVGGLAVGIHRGWPRDFGSARGSLAAPPTSQIATAAGNFPVVAASLEAYNAMTTTRRTSSASWLLDLRAIATAAPRVWQELPDLAAAGGRSATLRRAWEEAHAQDVAPQPPSLRPDPPSARLFQLFAAPSGAARGRLVPLIGEAAARPDHGPWPFIYDLALNAAKHYVGARLTRIDEGGESLLKGTEPIILAANHQDHLDYDTILLATPAPRRRRLRYVATEQVLAAFGSGHGLVGRGRAVVLRGVYAHVHRVIPIREHIRGRTAVAAMVDALAAGDTVVIFPEGVRNQDAGLARIKRGLAVLALETGVPILPVRIDGTRGQLPIKRGRLTRTKPQLTVRYRPPITVAAGDTVAAIRARVAAALAAPKAVDEPDTRADPEK